MNTSDAWDFWAREFEKNDIYLREWSDWNSRVDSIHASAATRSHLVYGQHDTRAVTSVIIPAYRRAQGLKVAVESALRQDFDHPYEVIVVDDSGADAGNYQDIDELMQTICHEHDNVVYYRNAENLGANDNWNRTIEICKTQWFCMLHDDDVIYPNYLSEMYGHVKEFDRLGIALVTPYFDLATEEGSDSQSILTVAFGKLLSLRQDRPIVLGLRDTLHSMFPNSVAMFINKEKAMTVGGLNSTWGVLADSVFFAQLASEFATALFPKKLCLSNKLGDSTSTSPLVASFVVMSYFQRTRSIARTLGMSTQKSLRLASESSVFAELALLNKRVSEINRIRTTLGISAIYNQAWYKQVLKVKKILLWGKLLLRR